MWRKIGLIFSMTLIFLMVAVTHGMAQKFPSKDITLICPWAAGGGTDRIARALVKNAKDHFGWTVNWVNKTGGMGAVGMGAVQTAVPDGYTVCVLTFQLSTYRMMGLVDLSYRAFG